MLVGWNLLRGNLPGRLTGLAEPLGIGDHFGEIALGVSEIRAQLEALNAITIAAVHGYCLSGGLQLAIACDIRVCSSDCRLGLPAVVEGIFPGLATVRLPRLIGLGPARRLILSGELIAAGEALRLEARPTRGC